MTESQANLYLDQVEHLKAKTKYEAANSRLSEAAQDHLKAADKFQSDPSDYNRSELNKAADKLQSSYDDMKKLDISEIFIKLYNNYLLFLSTLSLDKIVCIFNIIMDGLIFSSFFTILSIF